MQPYTFVFFGIVGSGKGTQIDLLKKYLKEKDGTESVYAYPGSEYRRLIESGNYVGSLIKSSMERGELQSDILTTSLVTGILVNSLTPEKHVFFDGYPRTVEQADSFIKILDIFKLQNVRVIYIELSKDESMKRNLLRGRADDTKEAIAKRFDEYINNVVPAMNYFKDKQGCELITINGEQSIEEVHSDIIKALGL